jgi:myo-inositol-1(or 4)-monophosphatase
MRENLLSAKKINRAGPHDIKLELDVRCQTLIERGLRRGFPGIPVLGEEGISGNPEAPLRWVVDPIDGTVNFAYGIPHACVSIALQVRRVQFKAQSSTSKVQGSPATSRDYSTALGVVYDPFCDELWTALRGQTARLNGKPIRVSQRGRLAEAIVSLGFGKNAATVAKMLPAMSYLIRRVRKIRIMGSAALAIVYVASGRMDAYLERGLRLWDIAAGGLILECAGGDFFHQPVAGNYTYRLLANNGLLRRSLARVI